jgi:hypothetical protein
MAGMGVEEREQLGDVGTVGGGDKAGERDAVGIGEQVVFAAGAGAIDGAGAGLVAPNWAGAQGGGVADGAGEVEPAGLPQLAGRSWWRRWKTPACCHSWRRRQQAIPEP